MVNLLVKMNFDIYNYVTRETFANIRFANKGLSHVLFIESKYK